MATTANHVLLRRITLTATAASVTFDGIPQTGYTDLKIVVSARDTSTSDAKGSYYTIGFNSGTSYSGRYLQGNGSTTGSGVLAQLAGIADTASGTASTFSNDEIYIPNYTSSGTKSYSVDTVTENNTTGAYATLVAGSWSGPSVTTITFTPSVGSFAAGSSFSLYGIADVNTTPTTAPKADGGDIIKTDGTYWYHAFLSTGTFKPQLNLTADVLVVAGGGSGGTDVAGGGGAGRVYLPSSTSFVNATSYVCTVGAGAASPPNTQGFQQGTKGTDSSVIGGTVSYTALGGGGGNSRNTSPATLNDGWNGGGGSYDSAKGPTAGNGGNAGGSTANPGTTNCSCGGGGGASAAGTSSGGGAGTNTYSSWLSATGLGVSGYIAGGGGGGYYSGTTVLPGGSGGGGNGGHNSAHGVAGTTNTGSGGGGGGSSYNGGAGGSGVIIIRYPVA